MLAGRRLANYLKVMTLEAQTIARACGKNHVHNLEPEDLVRPDHRGRGHGAACRLPGPTGYPAGTGSDERRQGIGNKEWE